MARRFTLAGLLLFTTFACLVLAFAVPRWRYSRRQSSRAHHIVSVAASADGSTFAALIGDGRLFVWDSAGNLKRQLNVPPVGKLALSFDGKLIAFATPRGSFDFYSVDTGKCRQTLALDAIRFSPADESFVGFGWGGIYAPRSLRDESPTALLRTRPTYLPLGSEDKFVTFSPDGKSFALVSSDRVITLYDAATSLPIKKLTSPSATRVSHEDMVWAPDGRSILTIARGWVAGDSRGDLATAIIERWTVASGAVRRVSLPPERFFHDALAYVPGDSSRFVAIRQSRLTLFDAETFKPLPVTTADYYRDLAAGVRGKTFVAWNGRGVDLLDASTLELRRRLFEAASRPSVTPVFVGLFAWFAAFFLHWSRQNARHCQTCGRRFPVAGKKDLSVECPPCRENAQRQLFASDLADGDATPPVNS